MIFDWKFHTSRVSYQSKHLKFWCRLFRGSTKFQLQDIYKSKRRLHCRKLWSRDLLDRVGGPQRRQVERNLFSHDIPDRNVLLFSVKKQRTAWNDHNFFQTQNFNLNSSKNFLPFPIRPFTQKYRSHSPISAKISTSAVFIKTYVPEPSILSSFPSNCRRPTGEP